MSDLPRAVHCCVCRQKLTAPESIAMAYREAEKEAET